MGCTVHKVQGLTLSKIVVSFELFKQRQFNYGQAYVALSRLRALSDLFILGDIDKKFIRADKQIQSEYERLRALQNLAIVQPVYYVRVTQKTLS